MEFNNKSDLTFSDISSESFREYQFIGAHGQIVPVRITNPQYLNVSSSGGHRIFDGQGLSHYVPPTWIHLHWEAKAGQPHFVR